MSGWLVLASTLLGGVVGVVVYLLTVFGPHYPFLFWLSVAMGLGFGLLAGLAALSGWLNR